MTTLSDLMTTLKGKMLPLTGGTLSGNLDIGGNATVSGKNIVRSINGTVAGTDGNIALDLSGWISINGERGQIAGFETAEVLSGSQTITVNSSDTICINTSGTVTLTFTAASATVCAVKVIALKATGTTTLNISGAVWANAGSAPTWGTSGKNLVLTASFINGRVVLNVYDNDQS